MLRLLLLAFLPIAAILHYVMHVGPVWVFVTGSVAVAVLADWVRRATDQVALHAGPAIGGLLTISFGSVAELILAFFVLIQSGPAIVRAQITGSIIGTTLFGLGMAMLAGGMRFERQSFKRERAGMLASMLVLVVIALLLPAVFDLATGARQGQLHANKVSDEAVSLGVSVILLLLYAGNMVFTLITHRNVFASGDEDEEGSQQVEWGLARSLAILVGTTVAIAFGAELVSDALGATAESLGLPLLFLGVIPLALIGTSSDLLAAIAFGRQNRMGLVMSICVGSAIQAALVIAPVLVLVSWAIGHPMTLVFSDPLDLFAIVGTVFIVNAIAGDGETTWFEGLLLVGVYALFAIAFFFTG